MCHGPQYLFNTSLFTVPNFLSCVLDIWIDKPMNESINEWNPESDVAESTQMIQNQNLSRFLDLWNEQPCLLCTTNGPNASAASGTHLWNFSTSG